MQVSNHESGVCVGIPAGIVDDVASPSGDCRLYCGGRIDEAVANTVYR